MNLKKILFRLFLFASGFALTMAFLIVMNGCASTDKAKVIDEIATIAKEKIKDELTTNDQKTETKGTEEIIKDSNGKEEQQVGDEVHEDVSGNVRDDLTYLNWTSSGDPHQITQCYFGYGHDSELFKLASALPVDFTCTLDSSGVTISKPASDDTNFMNSYPGDHMQARRAFVCLFNENNELVDCQDWAESSHLDNRWKDKGAVKGLVIHCKRGNAVSRTELTEVK